MRECRDLGRHPMLRQGMTGSLLLALQSNPCSMLPFGRYRVKAKEVKGQVEVTIEDSVVFRTFGVDLLLVGRVFFWWLKEGREFYLL